MEQNVINRDEFLQYLLQTQASLEQFPDYPLRDELDELIDRYGKGEDILPLLQQASEKEKHLIEIGVIPDEDGDGVGFFGALLELFGSLQGLGRLSWSALKDRAKKITQKINRVNPVTVTARNSLRILLSMNIFGYASAIMKSPKVKQKVINLYKSLGGKESYIIKALETGAKKKPLFAKKGTVHGLQGTNIQTLLKQAGSFLNQIRQWILEYEKKAKQTALQKELYAIRSLLAMNYEGYASILAKNSTLKKKVVDYYVKKGGRSSDIINAINQGAKKRPYKYNSTHRVIDRAHHIPRPPLVPSGRVHGTGELGEPITVGSLLASAGAFLLQIKKWLQEAGIKISAPSNTTKTKTQSTQHSTTKSSTTSTRQTATPPQRPAPAAPTAVNPVDTPQFQSSARVNVGGSSKLLKFGLGFGVGTVVFLVGKHFLLDKDKKEHALKGVTLK